MFREPISAERTSGTAGLSPIRAWLKRLGEPAPEGIGRPSAEAGFHALDDVSCIRIRRL